MGCGVRDKTGKRECEREAQRSPTPASSVGRKTGGGGREEEREPQRSPTPASSVRGGRKEKEEKEGSERALAAGAAAF